MFQYLLALLSLSFIFMSTSVDAGQTVRPAEFKKQLEAAKKGDVEAQLFVAGCYGTGNGVTPNKAEAVKWCFKAAEQGNVIAQFSMGLTYLAGMYETTPNYFKALEWMERAAEQGYNLAQSNVAKWYAEGILHDDKKALDWYHQAADQNDPEGIFNLGLCYAKGCGVSQDIQAAMQWFQKAAELGHLQAQGYLWFYQTHPKISEHKIFCTFTVTIEGQEALMSCDQDAISFIVKLSQNRVKEFTSLGYHGLSSSSPDQLNRRIQQQDYIEILKHLRTEDDLDTIIHFLEPYAQEGHPILMLELSRALCQKMQALKDYSDLELAYEWFSKALLTTELDAACNEDATTLVSIEKLYKLYDPSLFVPPQIKNKLFPQKKEWLCFANTLIKRYQIPDSCPSPQWLIYHGMGLYTDEASLLPEQKWKQARLQKLEEIQKDA